MSEEIKEMGQPAARITKISKGGRVWVTRRYPNAGVVSLQGHIDMRLYVNDQIKSDKNTFAAFEFWTGGQIGLNKDTEVEITGLNASKEINVSFYSQIRNPFKKQSDPLQIRTSAGVTGLKG